MTAAAMPVTDEQRAELEQIASSTSSPHRPAVLARTFRWRARVAYEEFARRSVRGLGYGAPLAFPLRRAANHASAPHREEPRTLASLPTGTVEVLLRLTHSEPPSDSSTHCSTRTLASVWASARTQFQDLRLPQPQAV